MANTAEDLYAAVVRNDLAAVHALVSREPSLIGASDGRLGSTPLHFAAHRGFTDVVRLLLECGADVHALERASGSTALHWAAEGGHSEIARMLLARGAALEVRDAWHALTPLGWATAVRWAPRYHEDRAATARLLLSAGARPDAFAAAGAGDLDQLRAVVLADPAELSRRLGFADEAMQPLHWAVAHDRDEAAALLVELGADLTARTALGLTPLATALRFGHPHGASALVMAGAAVDVSSAAVGGNAAAIRAAEALTPDLASRLLFVAAEGGHADAIGVLLERGGDACCRLERLLGEVAAQATPLHAAAQFDRERAARVLIDAGAPVDAGRDECAPTPLHVAAAEGHEAVARLLLERGADRDVREAHYRGTPADWALAGGHAKLAALLRDRSWPHTRPAAAPRA